jgi:hypothetical protein
MSNKASHPSHCFAALFELPDPERLPAHAPGCLTVDTQRHIRSGVLTRRLQLAPAHERHCAHSHLQTTDPGPTPAQWTRVAPIHYPRFSHPDVAEGPSQQRLPHLLIGSRPAGQDRHKRPRNSTNLLRALLHALQAVSDRLLPGRSQSVSCSCGGQPLQDSSP